MWSTPGRRSQLASNQRRFPTDCSHEASFSFCLGFSIECYASPFLAIFSQSSHSPPRPIWLRDSSGCNGYLVLPSAASSLGPDEDELCPPPQCLAGTPLFPATDWPGQFQQSGRAEGGSGVLPVIRSSTGQTNLALDSGLADNSCCCF